MGQPAQLGEHIGAPLHWFAHCHSSFGPAYAGMAIFDAVMVPIGRDWMPAALTAPA
jgi:hypothetical protein